MATEFWQLLINLDLKQTQLLSAFEPVLGRSRQRRQFGFLTDFIGFFAPGLTTTSTTTTQSTTTTFTTTTTAFTTASTTTQGKIVTAEPKSKLIYSGTHRAE